MKAKMIIAIAVALALILGIGTVAALRGGSQTLAAGGTLRLSVNPEIAVHFDADGNVTHVEARNADGKAILEGYAGFEGKTASQVVTELVEAIGQAGYFVEDVDGEGRRITLELEAGSKVPSDRFLQELMAEIQECVNENNWAAPVDVQREQSQDTAGITAEQAEAIALAHAEVKAEDARMERTELDRDRGVLHYDVEFTCGNYEYDYEIDATIGQVLHWEREYDPPKHNPAEPPATEPPATEPPAAEPPATEPPATQPETDRITAEEAEAIALAHAEVKAEDARMERTELDRDDGVWVYEVEFRVGNWEYSYEIHAETGEILEWEKDFDD